MYTYNQCINGAISSSWQYTINEIVRLERLRLTIHHNSFATGWRVYPPETDIWRNECYARSIQEQWHRSTGIYSTHPEQIWNSNFHSIGNIPTQSSHYQSNQTSPPSVESLIDLYLENRFYFLSLKRIYCRFGLRPEHARVIYEKYPNYFEKWGDLLFFKPQLKLCRLHFQQEGCSKGNTCLDIHLCLDFLLDACYGNCKLGHEWVTDHNMRVFRKFHMNVKKDERSHYLKTLLREELLSVKESNELQLCTEYDANSCTNKTCLKLHICFKYLCKKFEDNLIHISCDPNCASQNTEIESLTLKCQERHNIKSYHNKKILAIHKMDLNESSINLIMQMKNLIQIMKQINETSSERIIEVPKVTVKTTKTFWSHDLYGNVDIAEICYYSVEEKCRDEFQGCPRLHSSAHFHWQVQDGNETGNWYNFQKHQVIHLESSFIYVNTTEMLLFQLDPDELSARTLGPSLLERGCSWKVNFTEMMVKCCKTNVEYKIRRLCTELINRKVIKESIYHWYFYDKRGQWSKYIEETPTDLTGLKSSISSSYIENHFKKDTKAIINFNIQSSLYYICFSSLLQVNRQTGTEREIRRRPKPHLKSSEIFPAYWRKMKKNTIYIRDQLDCSSSEFQTIVSRIRSEELTLTIEKIERIQNPFLWKAFSNKVEEMTALYKNEEDVNIQYLYHGTKGEFLDAICAENFDWRLHGCNVGAAYGKGSYFSPLARIAINYCEKSSSHPYKCIFLVRVAVGQICIGNCVMTRPQINNKTKRPFDSTCDQLVNPQSIVKYDKQEYYPEYIIFMK